MKSYYSLLIGGITVFTVNFSDFVYAETNSADKHQITSKISTVQENSSNKQNKDKLISKLKNLSNQSLQKSHSIKDHQLTINSYSSQHLQPLSNNITTEYITQFPDIENQKVSVHSGENYRRYYQYHRIRIRNCTNSY
ncbi:MAG: hypothetical protein F6K62_02375 [Sphaerospermopsis sp. SIO1G2]|nr:hypothetical protein [Sphaerospermopsis sp. SIO1G2]